MRVIEVTLGAYIVPDAVGAIETLRTEYGGSGTEIFETTIRSRTGDKLFYRQDTAKLDDDPERKRLAKAHASYVLAMSLEA